MKINFNVKSAKAWAALGSNRSARQLKLLNENKKLNDEKEVIKK